MLAQPAPRSMLLIVLPVSLDAWKDAARFAFDNVDALIDASPANQDRLALVGAAVSAALRVRFVNPGVKKPDDVRAKMLRKRYAHAGCLTDAVRAAFEVSTMDQADAIVSALASQFEVLDEGWLVTPHGYFDRKVNVRFANGQIGEIQILERSMLAAKKAGGHKLFAAWRVLDAASPEALALVEASRAHYARIIPMLDDAFAALFA